MSRAAAAKAIEAKIASKAKAVGMEATAFSWAPNPNEEIWAQAEYALRVRVGKAKYKATFPQAALDDYAKHEGKLTRSIETWLSSIKDEESRPQRLEVESGYIV